jgi:hypothetical protein
MNRSKEDDVESVGSDGQNRPDGSDPCDAAVELDRIRHMPKEVGVLLIVAGIGGLLLPGPIGSPFVLLGGVILWPSVFERLEIAFEKRFPRVHRKSVRQIGRFITDLERRYPLPPKPGSSPD